MPPIRAFVPIAAPGALGMAPAKFYAVNIPAILVWAPAHVLPGVLGGCRPCTNMPGIITHGHVGKHIWMLTVVAVAIVGGVGDVDPVGGAGTAAVSAEAKTAGVEVPATPKVSSWRARGPIPLRDLSIRRRCLYPGGLFHNQSSPKTASWGYGSLRSQGTTAQKYDRARSAASPQPPLFSPAQVPHTLPSA